MPRKGHLTPHLELRRSGYFWRRCLPCPQIPRPNWTPPKKSFLCFSLRIHVPREAKILARRLTAMSYMVFAASAETTVMIAPHIQSSLLKNLVRFEIQGFERARPMSGDGGADSALLDLQREELLQLTARLALQLRDRDIARNPLRHVAGQLALARDENDQDRAAPAKNEAPTFPPADGPPGQESCRHADQPDHGSASFLSSSHTDRRAGSRLTRAMVHPRCPSRWSASATHRR